MKHVFKSRTSRGVEKSAEGLMFDVSSVRGSLLYLLPPIFKYVCQTNSKRDHQWLSVIIKLPSFS
jgi:hypothetical protein